MDSSHSNATAEPEQACFQKALRIRGLLHHAEGKPAEKVPERRLWLTGSMESSPGVCGLYRTARTEPMGDCLRLLFKGDARLSSAWGKPQDQQGASRCALPRPLYSSASTIVWLMRREISRS